MALQGGQSGIATEVARQASQRAHGLADHLDRHEPSELLDQVRAYARRRPVAFLAGAAVLGVLAGDDPQPGLERRLRAAAADRRRDHPAAAGVRDLRDGRSGGLPARYGAGLRGTWRVSPAYPVAGAEATALGEPAGGYEPGYGSRPGGGVRPTGQPGGTGPTSPGTSPATGPTGPGTSPATSRASPSTSPAPAGGGYPAGPGGEPGTQLPGYEGGGEDPAWRTP